MQPKNISVPPNVRRWLAILILAMLAALLGKYQRPPLNSPGVEPGEVVSGSVKFVDGDSFFVGSKEVRLKGIDAPEGRQTCQREGRPWACGEAARGELQRLVAGRTVSCEVLEMDQHSRILARCRAGETDMNRAMVASGMAVSYGDYVKEETAARIARRGLWAGEFEQPRAWRRRNGIGLK